MAATIIRTKNDRIIYIPTDKISPNRSQPRISFDENSIVRLADSIRRYGLIQPLTVRHTDNTYELIAGERRLRACKLLGYLQVPCVIHETNGRVSAEIALIENLMRDSLNMFEQARAFNRLIVEHGLTQDEIAKNLSMSQSAVANKLRLLKLSQSEQDFIIENLLTERHARALLRLSDHEDRKRVLEYIAAHKLTVSATDQYIDRLISSRFELAPKAPRDLLARIEDMVKKQCGTEYEVTDDGDYRVITIRILRKPPAKSV